ncbi:unnamed protein product [Schistosoma turkestanicum]|nr:unnamed protein product [Schistosoma turkestanicum]
MMQRGILNSSKSLYSVVRSAMSSSDSSKSSIYEFTAKDIDGVDVSLEKYRGYVCLIVNVAFWWTKAEIKKFVTEKFGVQFDMFSKINVNGPDAHPLYTFLKTRLGGTLTRSSRPTIQEIFSYDCSNGHCGRYPETFA